MEKYNPSLLVVGSIAALAAIGFLGITAVQLVYAQTTATPSVTPDLNGLVTSITGIITTIAALAGGIIASYAKMSQKLGTSKESEVQKMLTIAKELESSDHWNRQLDERIVALAQVMVELEGGPDALKKKGIDLEKWSNEASNLDTELRSIYKELIPLLAKMK